MKTLLPTVLLFVLNTVYSEAQEFTFRVELLTPDDKSSPASFFTLMFDGIPQKSNIDGIIYLTIKKGTDHLVIKVPDETSHIVLTPDKGLFYVPQDNGALNVIKLHKANNTEKAVADYTKALKKLNLLGVNMDSVRNANLSFYKNISAKQDSLLKIITANYQLSADNIRTATQLMIGRDSCFLPVTSGLEGYLNEAKDIRDIFKNLVEVNLNNVASFRLLDSTMYVYNEYYSKLNNNNASYERNITTFWKSEEMGDAYHNIADYAINNVHRTNIIPLNDLLIKKVNLYIHEPKNSIRKKLKQEIVTSINTIVPILDNNLSVLDVKVKTFNTKLLSERNLIPD